MAARMLCLNEAVGGGPLVGPTSMTTKYREDCHLFGVIQSLTRTPNIQIMFIEKLALNLHIDMYVLCLYTEIDDKIWIRLGY